MYVKIIFKQYNKHIQSMHVHRQFVTKDVTSYRFENQNQYLGNYRLIRNENKMFYLLKYLIKYSVQNRTVWEEEVTNITSPVTAVISR